MERPRAVIFDLDYTLAVSRQDRTTILDDAVEAANAPPLTRDQYLEAHSQHLTQETREPIFADLLSEYETDADPDVLARAYRQEIADALEALPGVEAMLADLRGSYRIGLLTNGPVVAQRDKLEQLGWEDLFDAALVTGELEAGKPDPRAFEAIAAALAIDPADAVYVGDDVNADIYGATNAGMDAIQVLLEDGPDPDPRAIAYVPQNEIATTLPELIADLES